MRIVCEVLGYVRKDILSNRGDPSLDRPYSTFLILCAIIFYISLNIRKKDIMFDYKEAERVIEMARQKIDPDLMIVFGSVAKGTADENSDLDLILVKESDEDGFMRSVKARFVLDDARIPVDITVYTPEEFKERLTSRYSLAYEALATGRIVHGSV